MSIIWNMPWLLLLATQPLVLLMLRRVSEQSQLDHYAKKDLQAWVVIHNKDKLQSSTFLRNTAYCLAWILFAVAAAGPRIAEEIPQNRSNSGNDIMVVLDISQSMHATDISPSRLKQAHRKIEYLVKNTLASRVGVVVYAAKPHLYVPLTYDKKTLLFYIKNLALLSPPSQGTQPLSALELASTRLQFNKTGSQSIILITDTDTPALKESSTYFSNNNIDISTLVIANKRGEAIPAYKEGWLSNQGRPIISRPNPESYRQLSKDTNGLYAESNNHDAGISAIIKHIEASAGYSNADSSLTNWTELYYLFLFPAIVLLLISMMPYRIKFNLLFRAKPLLVTTALFIILSSSPQLFASQDDTLREAYVAFSKQDYAKSRTLYASINNFQARYGEAAASYRLEDYPRAIRLFEQAVLLAESDKEFLNTLYSLGNSYFQTGNFELAIASFRDALLYGQGNERVINNLVYAKTALTILEKRKALLVTTARAGRGPRSARAEENITINESSTVSLDDSSSEIINNKEISDIGEIDIPEFIILKGLEFAKQASSSDERSFKTDKPNFNSAKFNSPQDNQGLLWKRIFELEEGYPAPLDEPEILPGIPPW